MSMDCRAAELHSGQTMSSWTPPPSAILLLERLEDDQALAPVGFATANCQIACPICSASSETVATASTVVADVSDSNSLAADVYHFNLVNSSPVSASPLAPSPHRPLLLSVDCDAQQFRIVERRVHRLTGRPVGHPVGRWSCALALIASASVGRQNSASDSTHSQSLVVIEWRSPLLTNSVTLPAFAVRVTSSDEADALASLLSQIAARSKLSFSVPEQPVGSCFAAPVFELHSDSASTDSVGYVWTSKWLVLTTDCILIYAHYSAAEPLESIKFSAAFQCHTVSNRSLLLKLTDSLTERSFQFSTARDRDATAITLRHAFGISIGGHMPAVQPVHRRAESASAEPDAGQQDVVSAVINGSNVCHQSRTAHVLRRRDMAAAFLQVDSFDRFAFQRETRRGSVAARALTRDTDAPTNNLIEFCEEPVELLPVPSPAPWERAIAQVSNELPAGTQATHAVFWMLRSLTQSMTGGSSGAFLTPALFMSARVWQQHGAPFVAWPAKRTAFVALRDALDTLIVHRVQQPDKLKLALVEFCLTAEAIQDELSNHCNEVPEIKRRPVKENSWFNDVARFGASLLQGASRAAANLSDTRLDRDQLSAWIKILQEICMRAQVIEEWMSACEKGVATSTQAPQPESSGWFRRQSAASEEEMMAQARFQNLLALTHRAADFVQIIFCAPLVRDARRLMERYAEQCATSLTSTTTEVVVT